MNNTTSSSSSINFFLLNQIINRYIAIPLLFFGLIGNSLNIFVFTRKIFRNNICVIYFLVSTLFDILALIAGLFSRILNGFNMDPSQNSVVLCKLRFFTAYFSAYAAAWFISLACIERYLSSSTNIYKRQFITMKRTYQSIIFVTLLGFLAFGEHAYCININQDLLGAPQSCYQLQQNIQCQIADSLMQFIFEILIPVLMMIVFGFLTLRNIHARYRRISVIPTHNTAVPMTTMRIGNHHSTLQHPRNNKRASKSQPSARQVQRKTQKRDAQLIALLLIQIIIFIVSSFPISIYKLYSVATISNTKSILQKSIEGTIFNMCVISLFLNNSIKFYIYTLYGKIFRKELMKLFRSV
ncbi:unnamed protein product [Adineta steineri]|uniref:G-protein coupled receptors family 1 profile domain-containing protein n=1 Tax=Adineta steineri TaxID=433720 RepID=A0A819DIU7_9BILA|nr:unnamed protein product [Adineta steineri]CAF3838316.1 unnamed protein product [Adineta steineri]